MDNDTAAVTRTFEALLRTSLTGYVAEALLMVLRALAGASDELAAIDATEGRRPTARRRDIAEKAVADFRVAMGSVAVAESVTTPSPEAPTVKQSGNALRRVVATVNVNGGAVPQVAAVDALRVDAQLVEALTGRRWSLMRDARGVGASWSELGAALRMSKQGAQDYYRRRAAEQGPQHDEYYRKAAPTYVDAQVGDFVLVMVDAFRGPDGEFAAADVVTVDEARPDEVEVEQPERLGGGGRAWVQRADVAFISGPQGPNPL